MTATNVQVLRKKMLFNAHGFRIGPRVDDLSQAVIAEIDTVEGADFHVELENSSGMLAAILKACPISGQRRHCYVDIRVQHLSAGQMPHKPGWHCDTTVQADGGVGDECHHLFVTGTSCLTPFIAQPIDLDYPTDLMPHQALEAMTSQIEQRYPDLKEQSVPSCTWVSYGPRDFHRVKSADFDEIRLLVRVRETNLANDSNGVVLSQAYDKQELFETLGMARDEPSASHAQAIANLVEDCIPTISKNSLYFEHLTEALTRFPPPFGAKWYGDLYRELAIDPLWFSASLLKNAVAECDGFNKAAKLAAALQHPQSVRPIADNDDHNDNDSNNDADVDTNAAASLLVDRHARDEWLHASLFLEIHDVCTEPRYRNPDLEAQIRRYQEECKLARQPTMVVESVATLVDLMVQINVGEIRALVQVLLLESLLRAHPRADSRVLQAIEKIRQDEVFHIAYSAKLVESWGAMLDKETLQAIFEQRVADINQETLKDTGGSAEGFYFTRINESMVKMDERRPINEASIAASTVAR